MGSDRQTIQNLKVVEVHAEEGYIAIKGALPGSRGSLVLIRSAVKGA